MTDLRHSRALRLGAGASGVSESETAARLARAHVALSVDPTFAGAVETAETLVDTLARRPGNLTLLDVSDELEQGLIARIRSIDPDYPVQTATSLPADATMTVHIGASGEERAGDEPHLVALPDNQGARLASDGSSLTQLKAPSSLGTMTTAALVAAEIFKHSAGVRPERMTLHRRLAFCPVTLSDDLTLAHALRATSVDLALVGLGAVGTAAAQILSRLPLHGHALLVDRQPLAVENLGTYSAGGFADLGRPKVDIVAELLTNFETIKFDGDIADVPPLIDARELPWPGFLLAGLDSVDARHATQRVWPDHLIDGATGDTAAGIHEVFGAGQPCLQCFLPPPQPSESSLVELAKATGLAIDQLANGDRPLLEHDLQGLNNEQRGRLEVHLGKPICGLAHALGLTSDDENDTYQPSVPFVSQLAAALVVGRLISRLATPDAALPNFVQFDALIGPQSIHKESRRGRSGCYCAENEAIIDAVRASRQRLRAERDAVG